MSISHRHARGKPFLIHCREQIKRSFRRYIRRYEEEGLAGLIDRRVEQASCRKAPVDAVMAVVEGYRRRHAGWNVKHFYAWYRRDGGSRSYT
ncbi:MAG: hypothetical protein N2Z69_09395, partial [Methylophilaceae bacterium]|nr:hypothetical protein [Methylophilaceae bacterium]